MLKKLQSCFALSATLLLSWSAIAQNAAQLPSNSDQARNTILAAVNAMGDSAAWNAISDSTAVGSCTPGALADADPQPPFAIRWIFAQGEFRFDAGTQSGSNVMLSGHGKPQAFDSDGTRPLTTESIALTRPYHLPGQVLAAVLGDNRFHISLIGNEIINGTSAIHVQYTISFYTRR